MLQGVELWKGFPARGGRRRVLEACTLSVPPGLITGIAGLNGVGKSTLLRILAGLLQPDRGRVLIHGRDLSARPLERRRRVALVQAETRGFYWRLSCRDNLRFFAVLADPRQPRSAREEAVQGALERFGLEGHAEQRFMTLSSGFMQRMALARGLLQGGEWLLLDEPSRELDPRARSRLLDLVATQAAARGTGVAWVTHRPDELEGRAVGFLVLGPGGAVTPCGTAAEASEHLSAGRDGEG
ncbi:MAG: ABC transporter ATP-binding protein [Deltaproteobacteria bacterium]|nr:ABC transporter ATP-binding protein [Deltaproteobacteria bacterium]